jgi:hypothetical protein
MFTKISVALAALAAVMVGVYLRFIRPWQLRWGATDEEVAAALPGDDVVKHATFNATRGVTIQARPEEIWPWVVQMGCQRAGWYSYDWIDNLGRASAERIIPDLQQVAVGDLIPISPYGTFGMRVKAFEPNLWMLWWDDKGNTTWYWGLSPRDAHATRLITRIRMHYHWRSPTIFIFLLEDVGDIVMMRKCLLGIKQRAEHASSQAPEPGEAVVPEQVKQTEPVVEA